MNMALVSEASAAILAKKHGVNVTVMSQIGLLRLVDTRLKHHQQCGDMCSSSVVSLCCSTWPQQNSFPLWTSRTMKRVWKYHQSLQPGWAVKIHFERNIPLTHARTSKSRDKILKHSSYFPSQEMPNEDLLTKREQICNGLITSWRDFQTASQETFSAAQHAISTPLKLTLTLLWITAAAGGWLRARTSHNAPWWSARFTGRILDTN